MTLEEIYHSRLAPWSDIQTQMPLLYEAVIARPEAKVLELGVRSGNSTAALLASADKVNGHVWSVDIDESHSYPPEWKASGRWTFICADDMTVDLSLLPARPDVLFIDSSHEFDHTVAELRRFIPLVAEGGVALFHDTLLTWDHEEYQVPQALDAFCEEAGLAWTERSIPPYGLGEILHPNG